jgi:hypothetical protein
VLLDEVLGAEFCLLSQAADLPELARFASDPIWRRRGVRLVAVGAAGASPRVVEGIEVVVDESGEFVKGLAAYRGKALLLRPDHYVAAEFGLSEPRSAVEQFETLIAGTWPRGAALKS